MRRPRSSIYAPAIQCIALLLLCSGCSATASKPATHSLGEQSAPPAIEQPDEVAAADGQGPPAAASHEDALPTGAPPAGGEEEQPPHGAGAALETLGTLEVEVEGGDGTAPVLPDISGFLQTHVRASVLHCHAQHRRKRSKLKLGQVSVTVELRPDGSIGGYALGPTTLARTPFARCMEERRKAWRIEKYGGDPVEVSDNYHLVQ